MGHWGLSNSVRVGLRLLLIGGLTMPAAPGQAVVVPAIPATIAPTQALSLRNTWSHRPWGEGATRRSFTKMALLLLGFRVSAQTADDAHYFSPQRVPVPAGASFVDVPILLNPGDAAVSGFIFHVAVPDGAEVESVVSGPALTQAGKDIAPSNDPTRVLAYGRNNARIAGGVVAVVRVKGIPAGAQTVTVTLNDAQLAHPDEFRRRLDAAVGTVHGAVNIATQRMTEGASRQSRLTIKSIPIPRGGGVIKSVVVRVDLTRQLPLDGSVLLTASPGDAVEIASIGESPTADGNTLQAVKNAQNFWSLPPTTKPFYVRLNVPENVRQATLTIVEQAQDAQPRSVARGALSVMRGMVHAMISPIALCDLDNDGSLTISDVQMAIDMFLTGLCEAAFVQQIVNAVLSGTCGISSAGHGVTLSWVASTTPNVQYNVYRSLVAGGPYTRINPSAVDGLTFLDTEVLAGGRYFYVVTAFANNSESDYSNEAEASIPIAALRLPATNPVLNAFNFARRGRSLRWAA